MFVGKIVSEEEIKQLKEKIEELEKEVSGDDMSWTIWPWHNLYCDSVELYIYVIDCFCIFSWKRKRKRKGGRSARAGSGRGGKGGGGGKMKNSKTIVYNYYY